MTYVKLEDVAAKLEALHDDGTSIDGMIHRGELREALRSLPTDDGVTDEMVERAVRAIIRPEEIIPDCDDAWTVAEWQARAALEAALGATVSDGWEDMSSAPRDRTSILAIVAPNDSRHLEYHAGRMFVIRHEGVTDNGYDLGWAVYPGFGGAPDKYFSGWRPLPAPPAC